jgi:hypothetical protein
VNRLTPSRAIRIGALACALVAMPPSLAATAQGAQERIRTYEVAIRIERSGDIVVTETIAYDFGATARHGIFRDLPVRLRYDDTFDRIYPTEILSVRASGGTPSEYEVEDLSGGLKRIRIGDPDRTITGAHTYEVAYRVEGALNGFADHDELYWNAIGTEWEVPIDRARVAVLAPGPVERVDCFAGAFGSTASCVGARARGNAARFEAARLPPHAGLTVVVAIPPGFVPPPRPVLEERWSLRRAFAVTPLTAAGAVALTLLVLAAWAWLLWRHGRDRRFRGSIADVLHGSPTGQEQAVPLLEAGRPLAEFAPPEDVRPGQIGTLIDERANPLDVSATIVDLAVRGFLTIEEIPKQGIFGKPDWELSKRRDPEGLLPYEAALLRGLFRDGDVVRLSELRTAFAERLDRVAALLYDDVVRRGWFVQRPDKVRQRWAILAFVALAVSIGLLAAAIRWTTVAMLAVPPVLFAVLLVASIRWMPRRTSKGTAMLRRVAGFRVVIDTSEKELARFAEAHNIVSRFLPYAIVFGLTERWARAFEQLGVRPDETGWYVSGRAFSYAAFGEAIDGFTVSTAGTIAARPAASGSSGFGGGGGAGGGGGGGGGGSW